MGGTGRKVVLQPRSGRRPEQRCSDGGKEASEDEHFDGLDHQQVRRLGYESGEQHVANCLIVCQPNRGQEYEECYED